MDGCQACLTLQHPGSNNDNDDNKPYENLYSLHTTYHLPTVNFDLNLTNPEVADQKTFIHVILECRGLKSFLIMDIVEFHQQME